MRSIVWSVVVVFAVALVADWVAVQLSMQLFPLFISLPTGSDQTGVPDTRLFILVSDGVFFLAQLVTVGAGFWLWTRVRSTADRPAATGRLLVAIGAIVVTLAYLAQLTEGPNSGAGISILGVDLTSIFIAGGGGLPLASAMMIVLGVAELMYARRATAIASPDHADAAAS